MRDRCLLASHHTARRSKRTSDACPPTVRPTPAASWRVQVEGQHSCVGSEQPRRKPAPGQVTLEDAVDLLALATFCLDRSTHLPQCSGWSPLRRPCTSLCWVAGNGSSICSPIPGRINRVANRYSGLFLEWSFGYEVHLSPLLTRHDAVQRLSLARRPLTPLGGTLPSRQPQPRTRSPRTARLYPPRRRLIVRPTSRSPHRQADAPASINR